ncbi:hypothetical protein CDAR_490791 [Caerostris darwini]|uniref:Uncharacterized protein n=1 Tax=Caerostris darwini TaxID=1538125 RepID=A0AAV4NNR6_9ARAC|nr:hypothetical protein CDAR_490791 [Caerostris darwini]
MTLRRKKTMKKNNPLILPSLSQNNDSPKTVEHVLLTASHLCTTPTARPKTSLSADFLPEKWDSRQGRQTPPSGIGTSDTVTFETDLKF